MTQKLGVSLVAAMLKMFKICGRNLEGLVKFPRSVKFKQDFVTN